jgi:LPXTG-motif cell wall-anchored protein
MSSRLVRRATVALLITVLSLAFAGPAFALSNPDYTAPPPPTVVQTPQPPSIVSPRVPAVQRPVVETAVTSRPVRSSMPITGSDVGPLLILGLGLGAAGAGILLIRRRISAA